MNLRAILNDRRAHKALRRIVVAPDEVLLLVVDLPTDDHTYVEALCHELVGIGLADRALVLNGREFIEATYIAVQRGEASA